jgi:glycosyltransferase involved in cell wall biosynthesis
MITHYFESHRGGIELVAGNLFRGIARRQCEITWAASEVNAPPAQIQSGRALPLKTWNGVERRLGVPFPVPSLAAFWTLRSAVSWADVVLLHDCLYLSNLAAFLFARLRGVPVMIVQHIGMVPYDNFLLRSLMKLANVIFTRPMLRRAEQVVFISQITQRYFHDVRFSKEPVLLFNGVDTGIFFPAADESGKAVLRERLDLPSERRVVLFVGRFVEKKGIPLLGIMARRAPEILWAFAGEGPLNPHEWGLANVKVYSHLRQDMLADLYRASDVLVLPSTGEGFPLVVQEALACGLPVICSAETVTADDALAAFVRGVPLSAGEPELAAADFLNALYEILTMPQSREIRDQRFHFVLNRYSWSRVAEMYYKFTSELASERHVARHARAG